MIQFLEKQIYHTLATVLLKAHTTNPLLSIFRIKFCPITANPMTAMSALALQIIEKHQSKDVHFQYFLYQEAVHVSTLQILVNYTFLIYFIVFLIFFFSVSKFHILHRSCIHK